MIQSRKMERTFSLTNEETDKIKNQLLSEMDNNDMLTAQFESVKLSHRTVIKQSDELISTLRRNIKSGTKDVEIEVTYNKPEGGKKTIKRTDTGEETIEEMHSEECDEYPEQINFVETEEMPEPESMLNISQLQLPFGEFYVAEEN